jgi:hypothetical protein
MAGSMRGKGTKKEKGPRKVEALDICSVMNDFSLLGVLSREGYMVRSPSPDDGLDLGWMGFLCFLHCVHTL